MGKDFRSDRLRAGRLIGSGSAGQPGIIILSASAASTTYTSGYRDTNILSKVGTDVFMFVSGTKDGRVSTDPSLHSGSVVLFGGDVVVSGTFYADKMVVEVEEAVTGSLSVSGSLFVSRSAVVGQGLTINSKHSNHNSDFIAFGTSLSHTMIATHIENNTVTILSGGAITSPNPMSSLDTNFFVSGTIDSAGTAVKGTSVFGGDLHVSGNLNIGGSFSALQLYSENPIIGYTPPTAGGDNAIVLGSGCNSDADYSVVGGGQFNDGGGNADSYTTIGGGYANSTEDDYSTIGGGKANFLDNDSSHSIIGGGHNNTGSNSNYLTIAGGGDNLAESSPYSSIGGGLENHITGSGTSYSTIGGGRQNLADNIYVSVAGGLENTGSNSYVSVGGGKLNVADASSSTIAGGLENYITSAAAYGIIAGGRQNLASSNSYTFIGGGRENTGSAGYTVVAGGRQNLASSTYAFIGGGRENTSSDNYASVVGGFRNVASGPYSSILGSSGSTASGYGTIAIGTELTASENYTIHIGGGGRTGNFKTVVSSSLFKVGGGFFNEPSSVPGPDVNFYVSGSQGSMGSNTRGTAVLGGDVVISGSLYNGAGASYYTAGNGLDLTGTEFSTDLKSGGGLKIDATELAVEPSEFAGTGLEDDGSDNLRIASTAAGQGLAGGSGVALNVGSGIGIWVDSTTVNIADSVVATVSGSTFTGAVMFDSGLSGSLTRLADGTSYLHEGPNINLVSESNGSVTIGAINTTYTAGDGLDLVGTQFSTDLKSGGGLKIDTTELAVEPANFAGTGLEDDGSDNLRIASTAAGLGLGGGGGSALSVGPGVGIWVDSTTVNIDDSIVATLTGSQFSGNVGITGSLGATLGLSGSLTRLADGTDYLIGGSGISITSASNGAITITNDGTVGDITAVNAGQGLLGGGSSGPVTLRVDDSIVATLTGSQFSGNVGVTGSLGATLGLSGSLTTLVDGTSYLVAGSGINITSASNGAVTIVGISAEWGDAGNILHPADDVSENVGIGASTNVATDYDIYLSSDGAAVFNEQGNATDFRVESQNRESAILVSGSTDQVLILSGGSTSSTDESKGQDVNFFVSGTINSHGFPVRGTSLFGGDLVASGNIHVGEYIKHDADPDTYIRFLPDSIGLTVANNAVLSYDNSESTIVLNADGAARNTIIQTANKTAIAVKYSTNQVIILSAGHATHVDPAAGADVNFYVSGSIGSKGTVARGTAIFGGDTVVSGTLVVGGLGTTDEEQIYVYGANTAEIGHIGMSSNGRLTLGSTGTYLKLDATNITVGKNIICKNDGDTFVQMPGSNVMNLIAGNNKNVTINQDQVLLLSGTGAEASFNEAEAADVSFYVSGTVGSRGTTERGTAVFGGDLVVSGALYVSSSASPPVIVSRTATEGNSPLEVLRLGVTDVLAAGVNTTIGMGPKLSFYTPNSTVAEGSFEGAYIAARKEDTGDARFDMALTFATCPDGGTITERMQIDSDGHVLPALDNTYNLGSDTKRWANVYTGDLHLRNDKGNWTIQEDSDKLIVINNITGKKYKMMLEPLEENE